MQLDDPALAWLCQQLIGHRDSVRQLFETSETPKDVEVDQEKDGEAVETARSQALELVPADTTDAPQVEVVSPTKRISLQLS